MSRKPFNGAQQLGRRIRAARVAKSMKQVELAQRCGVRATTVWRWEHGKLVPTLPRLRMISAELGADLGWLLGDEQAA